MTAAAVPPDAMGMITELTTSKDASPLGFRYVRLVLTKGQVIPLGVKH